LNKAFHNFPFLLPIGVPVHRPRYRVLAKTDITTPPNLNLQSPASEPAFQAAR
jgi:hypothetical protein